MSNLKVRYVDEVGTLEFDRNTGEGEIRFGAWFDEADNLTRADCLQDWIGLMTHHYNSVLTEGIIPDHSDLGPEAERHLPEPSEEELEASQ
jgi:hypothetical protein